MEPAARAVLDEHRKVLEDFGFEIEDFGGSSVLISSVPQILERASAREIVSELLTELSETPAEAEFTGKPLERLMRLMACKAAVKAGQKLSRGEIIAAHLPAVCTGTLCTSSHC